MAFRRLHQIMMNLPMVQASIRKRPLLLYLAISSYAIGALIAQEDGSGVEQPVYISCTLKDAKTHYPKEKKSMLGNSICFTGSTPLLPSVRGMADDEVSRNQGTITVANPLWKDIPVVTIVVTV